MHSSSSIFIHMEKLILNLVYKISVEDFVCIARKADCLPYKAQPSQITSICYHHKVTSCSIVRLYIVILVWIYMPCFVVYVTLFALLEAFLEIILQDYNTLDFNIPYNIRSDDSNHYILLSSLL